MGDVAKTKAWARIPGTIWALGLVSLLMDASSELIHSILPFYLTTTLGVSVSTIGWLEGMAEATAAIAKIFSGVLSDAIQKRKSLVLLGYGMAALSKPLFPMASHIRAVFVARFFDRIGKGLRGAPRDALISEISPADLRGTCFGLRQALDTVGACVGPLLALLFIQLLGDLRQVLWVGVVPAMLAVLMLIAFVKEPESSEEQIQKGTDFKWRGIASLPRNFWFLCFLSGVFTLARLSEVFLLLKAQEVGVTVSLIPLVMVAMNVVYAAVAYPAGVFSDRAGRHVTLIVGLLLLLGADSVLFYVSTFRGLLLGCALWGAHMGFTQGVFAAMVADSVPMCARGVRMQGTAFGVYYFIIGLTALLSGAGAGFIWGAFGAAWTFGCSAVLSVLTLIGILFFERVSSPPNI